MQMTEKLQDTENEAMAKIVELEKQLMHKNKELDSIRVSFPASLSMFFCYRQILFLYIKLVNRNLCRPFAG